MKKILIVDDDGSISRVCKRRIVSELISTNENVCLASDAEEALKLLGGEAFDLMITDKDMPGMSGVELVKKCAADYPNMKVVMMTGLVTEESAALGIEIINKPLLKNFIEIIKKALA
jgi:DNA-binding NtrC family response regulator